MSVLSRGAAAVKHLSYLSNFFDFKPIFQRHIQQRICEKIAEAEPHTLPLSHIGKSGTAAGLL